MDVFVFPMMNVTLFPSTAKPLNIFEPRYIAMVKESLATGTPIALAFVDDPVLGFAALEGHSLGGVREVAGIGMPLIIEENPQGHLMIMLQSFGKVKLRKLKAPSKPYMICEADVIEENSLLTEKNLEHLAGLYKILKRWIHHHVHDPVQREVFMSKIRTPQEILGHFSAYLVRDYDFQQYLLEQDRLDYQINILMRLLVSNELQSAPLAG